MASTGIAPEARKPGSYRLTRDSGPLSSQQKSFGILGRAVVSDLTSRFLERHLRPRVGMLACE